MVNKVYLIDLPISDTDFIKDICSGVSKEVYGNSVEIAFDSVNGKFAKTNIRLYSQKSSTFMVILSESVFVLLKDEMMDYMDKPNIFIYKDSDSFMKDVMERYNIKTTVSTKSTTSRVEVSTIEQKEERVKTEEPDVGVSEGTTTINLGVENADVEYYTAQINTLRSEKEILYDEIAELKERLKEGLDENKSSSMADLVICQNELSDAKKEISRLKTDNISSKKVLETTIRERDNYKAEATNAKESYQKVSAETSNLLERVKVLMKERDDLKVECSEEKAKSVKLEEDFMETVSSKDNEISILKADKINIQASLDTKIDDFKKLEEEKNKYFEDYNKVNLELSKMKTELDMTVASKEASKAEVENLQTRLDTTLETNKTLVSSVENYKKSSEEDKKSAEEFKTKYEECQILYDSLKETLSEKEKENEKLSTEVSSLKKDLSENLSNRDKEISNITEKNDEITRLKKEIDDLNGKIISMGNKSEELSKKDIEISSLKIEVSELRAQLTAKNTGVFSGLTQKVGIKSKIEDCLLNSDLLTYDSKLLTVFSANSDSIVDSCKHLFNKIKKEKGKCLVIDFNYDTFLDTLLSLEKNKGVKNFHGYIDGLVSYEECVYKTKFDNVSYTRLAKGFINENYLVSMNWGRFVNFIDEFNGKVFINAGVLSGSIKLLVYNTLCNLGNVEFVSKTTPVNLRSLLCVLSTLTSKDNLTCICVAPNKGKVDMSMIRKLKQKCVIVDEESIEIKN